MYLIKRVQESKLSTGIVDFRNSKDVCNVSRRVEGEGARQAD